ncbi:MAG: hypothetical protein EOO54_21000 [Haliea sp.]|nr:MAG: hypothetical protein EOO54_21000 [Haliea sp.]
MQTQSPFEITTSALGEALVRDFSGAARWRELAARGPLLLGMARRLLVSVGRIDLLPFAASVAPVPRAEALTPISPKTAWDQLDGSGMATLHELKLHERALRSLLAKPR